MKLPTRQKMEMKMKNRLSRTGIIIIHDPETVVGNIPLTGQFRRNLENMTDQGIIFRGQIESVHGMFFRNDQHMDRRNRCNIFDDNKLLILVNLFRRYFPGNDLTEKTIFHYVSP